MRDAQKGWSTSLIIIEMQKYYNKVSFHTNQNSHHQKICWRECREKGMFLHCLWNATRYTHCGELYEVSLKTNYKLAI